MTPPAPPLHIFDLKGKSKLVGVNETRCGTFFAVLPLSHRLVSVDKADRSEFGDTVYGPPRPAASEAKRDYDMLLASAKVSSSALRRAIAKLASLGGTKSQPSGSVTPIMTRSPKVELSLQDGSRLISGIRRKNVCVWVPRDAPVVLLERAIDVVTDVISSVVDSRLGILPTSKDIIEIVLFALAREGVVCPVSETTLANYILPLIDLFLRSDPWRKHLHVIEPSTDDAEVIHGFIAQFFDKARQADILGERKQLRRIKKQVRDRKKFHHTLYVGNIPRSATEAEIFALFDSTSYGPSFTGKVVYKVFIPEDEQTQERKNFAFVTCRSSAATDAVLSKPDLWKLGNNVLYVHRREDDTTSRSIYDTVDQWIEPSSKRIKICKPRLPPALEATIVDIVRTHPGCNVSNIPNLLSKAGTGVFQSVDTQKYGFKNLTQALLSIPDITLKQGVPGGDHPSSAASNHRPAYFAHLNSESN